MQNRDLINYTQSAFKAEGRWFDSSRAHHESFISMRWLLRPSRLFAIALIFLVGYSLIGFFLLSYVIKAFVLPAVSL